MNKGSRRGSRISYSSASATSKCSLQNHKIPEHPHTVVTDPHDLLNVNQQQHLHHQLLIHQNLERRRSSVAALAARQAQQHPTSPPPTQKFPPTAQEDTKDEVEVEIPEPKKP